MAAASVIQLVCSRLVHQRGSAELKKGSNFKFINEERLAQLEPNQTIVKQCLCKNVEVEADEMWIFVQFKEHQRCLWHAIDHSTGEILAYILASHEDEAFVRLKALLAPFGISQFYTDGWGAYERHLDPAEHTVGKRITQTIERKHLTLRTRIKQLVRKIICFSRICCDARYRDWSIH